MKIVLKEPINGKTEKLTELKKKKKICNKCERWKNLVLKEKKMSEKIPVEFIKKGRY